MGGEPSIPRALALKEVGMDKPHPQPRPGDELGQRPHSPLQHTQGTTLQCPRALALGEGRQSCCSHPEALKHTARISTSPQHSTAQEAQVKGPKITLDATPGTVPSLLG